MDRKNKMTGTGRGRKQRAGQGQAGSSGMGDSDVEERKSVGSAVVPGSPIGKVGRESHHRLTLPPIQHRDHPSSTPSPAAPMNAANDDPYHHYTGQQQPPTPGPYSNTYSSSAAGPGPVPTAAAGPHLAHPYSHPPPPPPYAAHPSAYPPYPHPHQHPQHIIYSATPPPHPAASAHHPHHQQHPQHHPQHHPHQHPHQHQVQAQQHHQHPHPHATPNPHYTHPHPGNASTSGSPVPGASGSPHPSSSMSISAGGPPPPPPGLVNGGASASVGPVSAPPTTAAGTSASPSVTASGKKRKAPPPEGHSRKKEAKSDNDDIQDLHKKRTKTQRACDSCRTRKIRCDVLTETDPPHCQHCKQYGFECTFFLPITETRFKKKRLEEEAAAAQQNAMAQARDSMRLAGPSGASAGRASVGHAEKQGEREISETASSPRVPEQPKGEVKVFGPTSMAHLLHSTATVPQRLYHSYDQRHNHVWEVGKTGDGFITVIEPRSHNHNSNNDDSAGGSPVPSGPSHPNNGNKETPGGSLSILTSLTTTLPRPVERDVLEKLINTYFQDVAPLVPIITASEFLASASSNGSNPTSSSSSVLDTNAASPPPILLYSICLVAAAKRQVPQAIFDSLRSTVNNLIKSEDVLSTASLVHVQALLILCQCGDCHGGFVPSALSAMWVRLGAAIRMAQDLGLHRSESFGGTGVGAASRGGVQMRRRLWAACVVTDRWVSLSYGHPYMIDVADCDTRFPSSGDPNDRYNDELVRLSLILGRVQKTIYTPSGITHATDEKLNELLSDMKGWKERLPDELKFRGSDTPREGGILHLLYSCVSMIFWRVFMRISYSVPEHLKFGMTVDTWTELVRMTGESIEWLNEERNEGYYDVWLLVSYAATSCALVQYHTWVRRKDAEAQNRLRMLRDCVRRWEASLQPEHMSSRRKTAEIITLLYEATLGPPPTIDEPPVLNPTGGVRAKLPASFKGLVFKKDPSRPGGGVFVARGTSRNGDYANIPEGVIVVGGEEHEHEHEEEGVGETGGESEVREKAGKEEEGEGGGDVRMGEVGEGAGAGVVQTTHNTSPQLNNRPALGTPSSIHPTSASAPSGMVSFAPLSGNPSPFTSSGAPPTTPTTTVSPTTHPQHQQTAGGGPPNLNPSLNDPMMQVPDVVQVMNVLDTPQGQMTLAQCVADNGLLEGIPGSMFDWPQWDSFFARFASSGQEGQFVGVNGQQQQQHQHQQQQQQQQHQH